MSQTTNVTLLQFTLTDNTKPQVTITNTPNCNIAGLKIEKLSFKIQYLYPGCNTAGLEASGIVDQRLEEHLK